MEHGVRVIPSLHGDGVMLWCVCGWKCEMGYAPRIPELLIKGEKHILAVSKVSV